MPLRRRLTLRTILRRVEHRVFPVFHACLTSGKIFPEGSRCQHVLTNCSLLRLAWHPPQVKLPPRDRPAVRSIPSSAGRDPGTPRPARKTDIWPPAGNTPGTSRKYVRDGNAVRIALPPETRGAPPLPGVNPAQLRKLCRFSSALEPRSLSTLVDKLSTRLAESHPDPTGFTGLRRSLACTGNPTKVC